MYTNSVDTDINIKKLQRCTLAIFGGTFDPIHRGHTNILQCLYTHHICDYVFIVPTSKNPLKKHVPHASNQDRMHMIDLAIREYDFAIQYPFEIIHTKVAFAVDTVRHIYNTFCPKGLIQLIIGSDVLAELTYWKELHTILSMAEYMVAPRPSYEVATHSASSIPYTVLEGCQLMDIDSSVIRAGIDGHTSYFLDPHVLQYIKEKKLYAL